MAYVEGDLGKEIDSLMSESVVLYRKGDYLKSLELLERAWTDLPEDKNQYSECYVIISRILTITLKLRDTENLNLWLDRILLASPQRGDFGEKEMWVGRVAYETGDMEKAFEYFSIANHKSGGRCFGSSDLQYQEFFYNNLKK